MDNQTYLAESSRTVSDIFRTDTVCKNQLAELLRTLQRAADQADHLKRHLFYGKDLDKGLAGITVEGDNRPLGQGRPTKTGHLLHAILGMYSEAGEMMKPFLEMLDSGRLDRVNLSEEAGDMEWYMALYYRVLNLTPEEVKELNIQKLRKRFPKKFSQSAALERDLDAERDVLEQGVAEEVGADAEE